MNLDINCQYLFKERQSPVLLCMRNHSVFGTNKDQNSKLIQQALVNFQTFAAPQVRVLHIKKHFSYLSPYTRCRFLLGLPPGVISRCLPPESSNSLIRALLSAFESIASTVERYVLLVVLVELVFSSWSFLSVILLLVVVGGVDERGGVDIGGVFKECWVFLIFA